MLASIRNLLKSLISLDFHKSWLFGLLGIFESSEEEEIAEINVEHSLLEAETKLRTLKERHRAIKDSQQQYPELQEKLQDLQNQAEQLGQDSEKGEQYQSIQEDMHQVQEQLHELELTLESQLFDGFTVSEKVEMFKFLTLPDKVNWFWHFLKYFGLGFGAAVLLKHFTS